MNLKKFIHTDFGRYAISILLGLGLATIFRKVCKDRNCMIFKAPNIRHIQNKIFKHGEKCYKYNSTPQKCDDNNRKIIPFA